MSDIVSSFIAVCIIVFPIYWTGWFMARWYYKPKQKEIASNE